MPALKKSAGQLDKSRQPLQSSPERTLVQESCYCRLKDWIGKTNLYPVYSSGSQKSLWIREDVWSPTTGQVSTSLLFNSYIFLRFNAHSYSFSYWSVLSISLSYICAHCNVRGLPAKASNAEYFHISLATTQLVATSLKRCTQTHKWVFTVCSCAFASDRLSWVVFLLTASFRLIKHLVHVDRLSAPPTREHFVKPVWLNLCSLVVCNETGFFLNFILSTHLFPCLI